jgi:hypothetical protein
MLALAMSAAMVSVAAADDTEIETRTAAALQQYDALAARAGTFLADKTLMLPAPPSLPLECVDVSAGDGPAQAYVEQALQPEAGLITDLRAARLPLQMMDIEPETALGLEERLAARLGQKADRLLKDYGRHLDRRLKMRAIAAFANRAAAFMQAAGDSAGEQAMLGRLSSWLAGLLPLMVSDLRDKHDYRQVDAIYRITRAANSSGASAGANTDSVYEQIEAAMRFELSVAWHVTSTGANGLTEVWDLKSDIPLRYDLGGKKTVEPILSGTAVGTYASYVDLDPDGPLTMTAPNFEVNAKVEAFDPCAGWAMVGIDRFYGEVETYHSRHTSDDLPMLKMMFPVIYRDKRKGGLFGFYLPVRNMQPNAIEETVEVEMGVFNTSLTFKLIHKPG